MKFVPCDECNGSGKQHSPGHNGDPMDEGIVCWKCSGERGFDEDDSAEEQPQNQSPECDSS